MPAAHTGKKLYVPLFAAPASKPPGTDDVAAVANPPNTGATTFASDMRMLRLRDLGEYEGMKMNKWGIREPEDWIDEAGGRTRREDGECALPLPMPMRPRLFEGQLLI